MYMSKINKVDSMYVREAKYYMKGGLGLAKAHGTKSRPISGPLAIMGRIKPHVRRHQDNVLPYNWYWHHEHTVRFYLREGETNKAQEVAELNARSLGWIREVVLYHSNPRFKAFNRWWMRSALPGGAAGSPYQPNLLKAIKRFRSPGAFNRRIWKVRRAAYSIMQPMGISPSNWAVDAAAIEGHTNPRRAGIQAVALMLTGWKNRWDKSGIPSYREAREILTDRGKWETKIGERLRNHLRVINIFGISGISMEDSNRVDTMGIDVTDELVFTARKIWDTINAKKSVPKKYLGLVLDSILWVMSHRGYKIAIDLTRNVGYIRLVDVVYEIRNDEISGDKLKFVIDQLGNVLYPSTYLGWWDRLIENGWDPFGPNPTDEAQAIINSLSKF